MPWYAVGCAVEVAEPLILGHDLRQSSVRAVVLPIQPVGLHRLHDLEGQFSIVAVCGVLLSVVVG